MSDDHAHAEPYEPPRIEERTPLDVPLIGNNSGGLSAAFRTDQIAEE